MQDYCQLSKSLALQHLGTFSAIPMGAQFIRPLSTKDEAVCPQQNHTLWHRTKTKEPSPLKGNLKTTVKLPWDFLTLRSEESTSKREHSS